MYSIFCVNVSTQEEKERWNEKTDTNLLQQYGTINQYVVACCAALLRLRCCVLRLIARLRMWTSRHGEGGWQIGVNWLLQVRHPVIYSTTFALFTAFYPHIPTTSANNPSITSVHTPTPFYYPSPCPFPSSLPHNNSEALYHNSATHTTSFLAQWWL